jgi:hypothetical protein
LAGRPNQSRFQALEHLLESGLHRDFALEYFQAFNVCAQGRAIRVIIEPPPASFTGGKVVPHGVGRRLVEAAPEELFQDVG